MRAASSTASFTQRGGNEANGRLKEETGSSYSLRRQSTITQTGNMESGSQPPVSFTPPLDRGNLLNTILLDCPFCKKAGCQGLPGIRTHLCNYCQSINKNCWKEERIVGERSVSTLEMSPI